MRKVLLLTILILTIGIIPVFFNFGMNVKDFDFITQQIPFMLETKRMFETGSPWWSWNTHLGDNFIGSYGFYTITSPFVWIVCLFPASKILWGILLSYYLKGLCCVFFAFLYLRRMQFNNSLCSIGALLYCFSSFYICNLYYFHFCEPIMIFPLLLIAIENVLDKRKNAYFWLSITSFVVVFINFYFSFSSFILGFIYLLFRGYNKKELNLNLIFKSILSVILGIGLSSFVLIPILLQNMGVSRSEIILDAKHLVGLSSFSLKSILEKYIPLLRVLIMPVTGVGTPGAFLADAPVYSSIQGFTTLFGLFPLYILGIRKRNWFFYMLLVLFAVYLTPLNAIFTGFTAPAYTRWLYGFNLFLCLAILYIIKDRLKVTWLNFFVYAFFCLIIIGINIGLDYHLRQNTNENFHINTRGKVEIALFLINLGALFIWMFRRYDYNQTIALVSFCGALNLGAFFLFQFNISATRRAKVNDVINAEIFQSRLSSSPTMLQYRTDIECNYPNISFLHNKGGVYNFHSIVNKNLKKFRESIDSNPKGASFINYRNRESVAVLTSVKYIDDYKDSLYFGSSYKFGKTFDSSHGIYDVYKFDYYIPFGFAYDSFVDSKEIESLIPKAAKIDIPLLLLDNLAINNNDISVLSKYLDKGNLNLNPNLDSLCKERKKFTALNFKGDSKGFTANTNFDKDRVIFFSVPADPGFKAYINGNPTKIYEANLGMMAIVVPKGKQYIEVNYFPPGVGIGVIISIVSLLILVLLYLYNIKL